jgi:hypothetical protein
MKAKIFWILITALFCTYSLFLAFGSIEGFPTGFKENVNMPYLSDRPVGEDGFYMLTVAWNIPIEKKICYNFGILTSGIQPLNTFVFSVIAYFIQNAGLSKWDFIRAIILFEALNLLLFSLLIYRISLKLISENADKTYLKLYCASLTLLNFTLFKLFTYGLETGLYLNLFAFVVLYSLKIFKKDFVMFREWLLLSILMGITVITRIDFGIICAGLLFILLLKRKITLHRFLFALTTISIFVLPWLIYIKFVTDSWIPSSGEAQSAFISSFDDLLTRLIIALTAIFDHSVPYLYTANRMILGVLCLLVLLTVVLCYVKFNKVRIAFESKQVKFLFYWLISLIPVIIIYVLYFTAVHFYIRYFAPLAVMFTPLLVIVLYSVCLSLKNRFFQIAPVILSILSFFIYSLYFFHSGHTGWSRTISAGYIYNSKLQSKKIGAFQSGVIGYFNSNVFNLDGKIDHEALRYLNEKRIDKYIDTMKIDFLNDWPLYLNNIDSNYLFNNWSIVSGTPQDSSLYYIRIKIPSESNNFNK